MSTPLKFELDRRQGVLNIGYGAGSSPTFTNLTVTGVITTPSLTSPAASPLTLGTTDSGAAITVLSASNNVGIGTITPQALFTISAGSGTKAVWQTTRSFGTNRNFQLAVDEHAEGTFTITPSTTLGGSTYTTPAVTLTSTGVVSISNTTAGSANAGALVVTGGLSAGNNGNASYFGGAATFGGAVSIPSNARLDIGTYGGRTGFIQDTPTTDTLELWFKGTKSVLFGTSQAAIIGAAGGARLLNFGTGTSGYALRWITGANSTAESGSNAGSDYILTSYDDAGSTASNRLTISRATGAATFSGAVSVGTGAAVGGATAGAGGLAFPATAVAVADANTLDDYEEGTWTPTLSPPTSGSGTITVASPNLCGYTKIGRVVTVNGMIEVDSVSLPVGAIVEIGGLPFASNANSNQRSIGAVRAFALTTGVLNSALVIASSTQTALLYVDASLFQATSQVYFQLTYTV